MNFSKKQAEIFVPGGEAHEQALSKTTDLCIAAHQDDIEIMAYGPVAECYGSSSRHFSGVIVTDGAGSPRIGVYGEYSEEAMKEVRVTEQKNAASIGRYSSVVLLGYSSSEVRNPTNRDVINEIKNIILESAPETLYTHNLADKHDTHVAVALHVIRALREIPIEKRPKKIMGMEVWRGLDWLCDEDKTMYDTGAYPNLAAALIGLYDSQISGGKRYDLAAQGRWMANATYFASHDVDELEKAGIGLDMTEMVNSNQAPGEYIIGYIEKFKSEVAERVAGLIAV